MALTIGELVGYIDVDDRGMRRGLSDAELRMRGFTRGVDGRLRTLDGRFARLGDSLGDGFRNADREGRRLHVSLGRIGSMAGSIGAVAARAGVMAAQVGAIAPAAAAAAAALASIAPAAAVGATAVLALGQAMAALRIGTAGVGSALSAAFKSSGGGGGGGGGGAGGAAKAAAAAQLALKDAIKQAAEANERAAERVKDAEVSLVDAQKEARAAQLALNAARKQGAQDLEDLNNQLVDAQLDQEDAILDVADAEEALNAARASGDPKEIKRAELAYARAVQRLKEQRTETKRLSEETAAANRAGVDGSEAVRRAQERIADTQRTVKEREEDLADARKEAARTAADGIEQVRRAQQALKDAMSGGGGGGGGGIDPFAEAMAKLAPSAQEFVRAVIALKPAWDALRLDVQQHLFQGLAKEMTSTAGKVLPVLRKHLVSSADALNLMGKGVLRAARDLAENGTLGKAMRSASAGLQNLSRVPGQAVTAFGQISEAAAPAFERLTRAAGGAFDKIADKLSKAFESGQLRKAIDKAIDGVGQLFDILGNLGETVGNIFGGLTQDGGGLFDVLEKISEAFVRLSASSEFQSILKELSDTVSVLIDALLPVLEEAFKQLAPVIVTLAPVIRDFIKAIGPELVPIIEELGPVLVDIAEILRDQLPMAIEITKAAIDVIVIALQALHWVLENIVQPAVKAVADAFNSDYGRALRFGSQLTATKLGEMGTSYNNFRQRVVSAIQAGINIFGVYASNLRDRFVKATVERVAEVVRFFQSLPGRIRTALGNLNNLLYGAGQSLLRGFMNGIRSMVDSLRSQLSGITSMIPDLKGPPEKDARLLTPAGRSVIAGFQRGIAAQLPALQQQLAGITTSLPGMTTGPMAAGAGAYGAASAAPQRVVIELRGPGLKDVITDIVQVSGRGDVQVAFGQR